MLDGRGYFDRKYANLMDIGPAFESWGGIIFLWRVVTYLAGSYSVEGRIATPSRRFPVESI